MSIKEILDNLNISIIKNIDNFFESNYNKYDEEIPFDNFKIIFIKFFSCSTKIFDKIIKETKTQINKNVNLTKLLLSIYRIRNKEITTPLFLFYIFTYILNEKYNNYTTLEFITLNGLSIEDEININQFFYKISKPIGLSDLMSLILFKSFLIEKKGTIKMSDFLNVIDSFRNENNELKLKIKEDKNNLNNEIGIFIGLCNKNNVSEIEIFKYALQLNNNNDKSISSINDENIEIKLESLKKAIDIKLKNKKISEAFVNLFNNNNNDIITFKQYIKVICNYKSEKLLYEINTIKFEENEKRNNLLPYKGNHKVFNKLKYEISNMLNNFYSKYKINKLSKTEYQKKQILEEGKSENNSNYTLPLINPIKKNDEYKKKIENYEKLKKKDIKNFTNEILPDLKNKWNIIDCLENYIIINGFTIPTFDLENYLLNKKELSKKKISTICSSIDYDKDGYISYYDIIYFLLNYFNYQSIILCWRFISSILLYKHEKIENFFLNKNLKLENEVDSNEFYNVIYNEYSFDITLINSMYENLSEIAITKFKRNVIVNDIKDKIENEIKFIQKKKIKSQKNQIQYFDDNFNNYLTNYFNYLIKGFESIENLDKFLNLNEEISLKEFKNNFIKKCNCNECYGIKLFFELKKENSLILKEEFLNKIREIIQHQNLDFNIYNLFTILSGNNKEIYLIKCFENSQYNINGISSYELFKSFKSFFPTLSEYLIKKIIMEIDKNNNGIIPYINLLHTINKYLIEKNSYNLVLKVICSYLDINNYKTKPTLQSNILIPESEILKFNSCQNFFKKLGFNIDEINVFINKNIITLSQLINDLNNLRIRKNNFNLKIDNEEILKNIQNELITLKLNFEDISSLNISFNLELSIEEIISYIENQLNQKELNYEFKKDLIQKLFILLKCYDGENKGKISYKSFYLIFNQTTPSFHMEYITIKILTEYNGDLEKYMFLKNISENKFLSKTKYKYYFFDDEMMEQEKINDEIYNFFEEDNMFSIRKYIKYIKFIQKNLNFIPIKEENIDNKIKKIIFNYEDNNSLPFYSFYDNITIDNNYGKIKSKIIKKIFQNIMHLKKIDIYIILRKFSNQKLILFDLFSFTKELNSNSIYKKEINELIDIIKKKNKANIFSNIKEVNINEFFKFLQENFEMSLYESIILFVTFLNDENNQYKDSYELDMKYFLEKNNIKNMIDYPIENDTKLINQNEQLNKFDDSNKKKLKKKKNNRISRGKNNIENSKTMNIFHKFSFIVKIKSKNDLYSYFEKYDKNQNGFISREELFDLLNTFEEFNDYERMLMLNFATQNYFEKIFLNDLINLINSVEFDENELDLINLEISKNKNKKKKKNKKNINK